MNIKFNIEPSEEDKALKFAEEKLFDYFPGKRKFISCGTSYINNPQGIKEVRIDIPLSVYELKPNEFIEQMKNVFNFINEFNRFNITVNQT